MTVFLWDKTSQAANATADPTINWPEGMAPSVVNDSARSMMVAIAKWRDDLASTLTTAGTAIAYTVATNQVFTTLVKMSGKRIGFIPHVTNGPAATLNVDGLGAKPLQLSNGVAVPAGQLIAGQAYTVTYNDAIPAFLLHAAAGNALLAPAGTAMMFQMDTPPVGWTKQTTHNDKSLRLVSGTPATGGSVAFSTLFGRTATDPVTLAVGHLPAHSHTGNTNPAGSHNHSVSGGTSAIGDHTHSMAGGAGFLPSGGVAGTVGATGLLGGSPIAGSDAGGAHAHAVSNTDAVGDHAHSFTTNPTGSGTAFSAAIDCRVQYVDVIIATKDA
jgi:hypothetical protein